MFEGIEDTKPLHKDIGIQNPATEAIDYSKLPSIKESSWPIIQGKMAELKKDYEGALKFYQKALDDYPAIKETLWLKGNVYRMQKEHDLAIKNYNAIPLEHSVSIKAYSEIVKFYKDKELYKDKRLKWKDGLIAFKPYIEKVNKREDNDKASPKEKAHIAVIRSYIKPLSLKFAVVPFKNSFGGAKLFFEKVGQAVELNLLENTNFNEVLKSSEKHTDYDDYDLLLSLNDKEDTIYMFQSTTSNLWYYKINISSDNMLNEVDNFFEDIMNRREYSKKIAKDSCDSLFNIDNNITKGRHILTYDRKFIKLKKESKDCLEMFPDDLDYAWILSKQEKFKKEEFLKKIDHYKENIIKDILKNRSLLLTNFEKETKNLFDETYKQAVSLIHEDPWTSSELFKKLLNQVNYLHSSFNILEQDKELQMKLSQYLNDLKVLEEQIKLKLSECDKLIFANLHITIKDFGEISTQLKKELEKLGITKIKTTSSIDDETFDSIDLIIELITKTPKLVIKIQDMATGEALTFSLSVHSPSSELKKIVENIISKRQQLYVIASSKENKYRATSDDRLIVRINPDSLQNNVLLANTFLNLERYNDAFKYLKKSKEIAIKNNMKDSFFLYYLLSHYYATLYKYDTSLRYALALKDIYDSAMVYSYLGSTYLMKGDYKNAEEALKKAIEKDPTNYEPYGRLAKMYFIEGKYEPAYENINKAIDLSSNDPLTRGGYGLDLYNIYQEMGKHNESENILDTLKNALKDYEDAFRQNPLSYSIALRLGITYIELKEYDKAERWLKKAEELAYTEHSTSEPLKQRAWLHMMKKEYKVAKKLYEDSIEADQIETYIELFDETDGIANVLLTNYETVPVTLNINYGARYELAWLYDLMGQRDKSKKLFKETINMDRYNTFKLYTSCGGKDTSCSYFKALIYEVKGEQEKARREWEKYLEKIPAGWFSDNAREHLKRLEETNNEN